MVDSLNEELKNLEELLQDANYMPSKKEILDLLETSELDDEMKESLRSVLGGALPQLFGGYGSSTYVAIGFVAIIFFIILFFGYKLYKSIKDKEKKREEKKKLKQMKKKK